MKKRFIFDESYNKKQNKKDFLKLLLIIGGVVLLIIVVVIIVMVIMKNSSNNENPNSKKDSYYEFKDELTIESGDNLPDVYDYFKTIKNVSKKDIQINYPLEMEFAYDKSMCSIIELEEINSSQDVDMRKFPCIETYLKSQNTYGVNIKIFDKEHTVKVIVKDTTAPIVSTNNIEIYEGKSYEIKDFVSMCFDINDECIYNYYDKDLDENGNIIDYSNFKKPGEYNVKIIVSDKFGNKTEPTISKLTIIKPEAKLYNITFDSNGGSEVKEQTIEENDIITKPLEPTRSGYKFIGWYLNDQEFNFTTKVTSDLKLVAKWEKIESQQSGNNGEPSIVKVSSVSLNYSTIYLYVNDTKTVTATVKPSNAVDKTISWKSANNNIAKVDNGKITGLKVGTTTVTATAGGKSAQVTVVVKDKSNSTTCKYGDISYNSNIYTKSVDLTQNNCAVNPNLTYNETLSTKDYLNLVNDLNNLGYKELPNDFYSPKFIKIPNSSGLGIVGYQIQITVKINNKISIYVIKSNGSRSFVKNEFNLK